MSKSGNLSHMETERAQRVAAGRASGAARRARVRERDRAMALERARWPGRSYARIGAPHGLTRAGTRKAVLRAMADPANRAAIEAAGRERREFLGRFAEGSA